MFDAKLLDEFDTLASRVGLCRTEENPNGRPEFALPGAAQVWKGDHALVVLCPASHDAAEYAAVEAASVRWLGDVLDAWRQERGRIADGYLILVMSEHPDEAGLARCKASELQTRVCRRHVVWPDGEGDWMPRLSEVTVLALPKSGGVTPPDSAMELPPAAARCLQWFGEGRSLSATWSLVEEAISKEAQDRGHNAD